MRANERMKDKIGKWIGNFFLLASCVTIPCAYLYLYNYGHIQCAKLDIENDIKFISTGCYAIIFTLLVVRLSNAITLDTFIKKLGMNRIVFVAISTISGIILLIAYMFAGFKAQEFIESSVDQKIRTQLNIDGVRVIGVVEKSYSKFYGRRDSKIRHDQIEIRYVLEGKTIHSCYAFDDYQSKKINKGDTLNFIVSTSKTEYILLKN
jgi:hypothetical protein